MKTCLIIEDNAIVRGITVDILTQLGIETIETDSADVAIAHCVKMKPDLVMLDWDLPSMKALDFLQGVGDLEPSMRPMIMLCATENDHKQFSLAKAAGAEHHILKPFDKMRLEDKLMQIGMLPKAENQAHFGKEETAARGDKNKHARA